MAGRPRLPVGTFGEITTTKLGPDRFRVTTRFRDWDGQRRQVTATRPSRRAAEAALKVELANRVRMGGADDSLHADSPFSDLRHSEATAQGTRERGLLVYKLDEQVRKGPKWHDIRRGHAAAQTLAPRSSSSVADDLRAITQEVV
ncbi:hypothetical protein ACFDTO_07125 [Microbacteriaceae bacterium 4G12]